MKNLILLFLLFAVLSVSAQKNQLSVQAGWVQIGDFAGANNSFGGGFEFKRQILHPKFFVSGGLNHLHSTYNGELGSSNFPSFTAVGQGINSVNSSTVSQSIPGWANLSAHRAVANFYNLDLSVGWAIIKTSKHELNFYSGATGSYMIQNFPIASYSGIADPITGNPVQFVTTYYSRNYDIALHVKADYLYKFNDKIFAGVRTMFHNHTNLNQNNVSVAGVFGTMF
jgi:hypothetical protein